MKKLFITLAFALTLSIAHAGKQAEEPASPTAIAQLDGYALGLTQAGQFSGVLLVAKNDQILLAQAYGKRDESGSELNTVDTRFNLASLGKMFTAVAILQQVAAKRISLDSKVGEILKDYPNKDFARKVTIRHLLTHTAGAGDIDLFGANNSNRTRVHSVADMMALHANRAPAFKPGSSQAYGNFGHVVLGRMVEVLSNQTFEDYLQTNIFDKAGMLQTGFVNCTDRDNDIAVGYVNVDGKRVPNCATLPQRGFPAGGQVSTVKDLLKFVRALQTGKLLPSPLFQEAIRPQYEFMGLGFFATEYGPGIPKRNFRWGHGGSADGICTEVRTYPETSETIVVLTNMDPPGCFTVSKFLHQQWDERHQKLNSGSD